jgi:hypothetical protein
LLWSAETPYEQVRSRQDELLASARRAHMLADLRRRTKQARRTGAGRFSQVAQRVHATLVRP